MQTHEPIPVPPRNGYPQAVLYFEQPRQPVNYDAKFKLLEGAKRYRQLYLLPITPTSQAKDGQMVETLGTWLFGRPGYGSHIRVIPYPDHIDVLTYSAHPVVMELLQKAGEAAGWKYLATELLGEATDR